MRDFLKNRWVMVAGEDSFVAVLDQLVRDKTLTLESGRVVLGLREGRQTAGDRAKFGDRRVNHGL
jgi:hypothetical protein